MRTQRKHKKIEEIMKEGEAIMRRINKRTEQKN